MTKFLLSTRSFMTAISLAALTALMLPQNADAQRPSLGGIDNKLNDVQETLGPVPAPGNDVQQRLDAQDEKINRILDVVCSLIGLDRSDSCNKFVFATSTSHLPDFGGLAGGDAICNARAAEAGLPGEYKAWLSDSTGSPSTRFSQSSRPYVRTDGALVANDYADLTDGVIVNPINRDENGTALAFAAVITGTSANGTPLGGNCQDWTVRTPGLLYRNGFNDRTDAGWSTLGNTTCGIAPSIQRSLYCFQQ